MITEPVKFAIGVVFAVTVVLGIIIGITNLVTGDEKTSPPAKVTVDMPDGYSDVIMKCVGANGVYTNLKGAIAVIQSDMLCDPPTIEVPSEAPVG